MIMKHLNINLSIAICLCFVNLFPLSNCQSTRQMQVSVGVLENGLPKVIPETESILVQSGASINIFCNMSVDFNLCQWFWPGNEQGCSIYQGEINENNCLGVISKQGYRCQIHMDNMEMSHAGLWSCSLNTLTSPGNQFGYSNRSVEITNGIAVELNSTQNSILVNAGDSLSMACSADYVSEVDLSWKIGNDTLTSGDVSNTECETEGSCTTTSYLTITVQESFNNEKLICQSTQIDTLGNEVHSTDEIELVVNPVPLTEPKEWTAGEIAALVLGILAFIGLIILLLLCCLFGWCCFAERKRKDTKTQSKGVVAVSYDTPQVGRKMIHNQEMINEHSMVGPLPTGHSVHPVHIEPLQRQSLLSLSDLSLSTPSEPQRVAPKRPPPRPPSSTTTEPLPTYESNPQYFMQKSVEQTPPLPPRSDRPLEGHAFRVPAVRPQRQFRPKVPNEILYGPDLESGVPAKDELLNFRYEGSDKRSSVAPTLSTINDTESHLDDIDFDTMWKTLMDRRKKDSISPVNEENSKHGNSDDSSGYEDIEVNPYIFSSSSCSFSSSTSGSYEGEETYI